MIELILGTYGVGCWLIFAKFKLVPVTTYTVCTAVLGGIVIFFSLMMILSICHPCSHDGRLYAAVTRIVPQVRGRVVAVPVAGNVPLREGDVLFEIDPVPYRLEVERLEAMLAEMNAKVAQLDARLAAAHATTEVARSNLLVSESDYDRQARIALQNSQARIEQVQSSLTLAKANLARYESLKGTQTVTRSELEKEQTKVKNLEEELTQARSAAQSAQETLDSGGARLAAARDELKNAEAAEREAQIALDAESDGENPAVRQTMAELDRARWDLEQTTVRAPSDGYVTHVFLRPGQMATPLAATSAMTFVPDERPSLVASFPQNCVGGIEPGLEAELAFKAYPGQIFQAKVLRVLPITPEGQAIVTGQIQSTTEASEKGQVPVVFEYGEDVAALNLPAGAQVSVAVYTHHFHAMSIVRKIILRIKSWENYAFFLQGLDAVH
jgi:multidrug resistance efflux pump